MESVTGMLIPVGTIVLIFLMQMSFWQRTNTIEHVKEKTSSVKKQDPYTSGNQARIPTNRNSKITPTILKEQSSSIIIQDQPSSENKTSTNKSREKSLKGRDGDEEVFSRKPLEKGKAGDENENEEDWFKMNDGNTGNSNNNWRCACEFGFLPAGMLKTFGSAEAIAKLGIGQCYHKQ